MPKFFFNHHNKAQYIGPKKNFKIFFFFFFFQKWLEMYKFSLKSMPNTQNRPKRSNFLKIRLPVQITECQPVTIGRY
jgi:hypothetical protein